MKITHKLLKISAHSLTILFFLLLGSVIAIYLGKDMSWDFAAYHYYNPYAFLNNRWDIDYWPSAIIQAYLNPTLDFLTYFAINMFHPLGTQFLIGIIHGMNFCLTFYLCYLLLSEFEKKYAFYLAILLTLFGLSAPNFFSQIGSFNGDNFVSIFVLASVLLQLLFLQKLSSPNSSSIYLLIGSGALLGIGLALKLTTSLYVIGFLIACLFLPIPFSQRIKYIAIWLIALSSTVVLFSGYWMLFLWQRYHNPFFPLFNGVFQSTDFPTYNWIDKRHFASSLWENIFYPFYFSWNGKTTDLERFIDYRFPIAYILFVITGLFILFRKIKKTTSHSSVTINWFLIFFLISYISWQVNFSIMRYFVSGQILCPLLIYLLLFYLIRDNTLRYVSLACILSFLLSTTMYPDKTERSSSFHNNYFAIKITPAITNTYHSLVLTAFPSILTLAPNPYPFPENYLIPFLPSTWQFVGVPFEQKKPFTLSAKIKNIVGKHNGLIYLLGNRDTLPGLIKIAHELKLRNITFCHKIVSDLEKDGALLCLAERAH